MGGIGSGNWSRWDTKPRVERCHSLATSLLVRKGVIEPGAWRSSMVTWSNSITGEQVSAIGIDTVAYDDGTGLVRLRYTLTGSDGQREPLDYPVRLVTTRPHLGGVRWWFICPLVQNGVPCGRRVAKLYRRGRYFGCRACHGLAYRSSQEAHQAERNRRMLGKILARHRMSLPRLVESASSLSSSEFLYLVRALD
jgi:hypothetical protein